MAFEKMGRRRWIGVAVLLLALLMLGAGATVLQGRLSDVAFLFYWLGCMGFTVAAIIVAFLDVRAVQRETRQEHKELLDSTLRRIETDAKTKRRA